MCTPEHRRRKRAWVDTLPGRSTNTVIRAQSSPAFALTQMAYSLLTPRRRTSVRCSRGVPATNPMSVVMPRDHRDAILPGIEFAFE
jgi:hypothetical protein